MLEMSLYLAIAMSWLGVFLIGGTAVICVIVLLTIAIGGLAEAVRKAFTNNGVRS